VHGKWTGHVLDFEYLADGQLRRGSDNVDTSTWKKFVGSDGRVVPGPITVNVSRVGPLHTALLRKNETPMLMWFIVPAAFCMVPWIGYALWYLRLAPARARRICATGTAVPCTITEKRTRQKKGCTIYDLAYEFHAGPQQIRGKFTTDPGAWAPVPVPQACVSVQPGQTLTALYLPDNPRRHLVYELSRFVIS
jgi:hypothetical protein